MTGAILALAVLLGGLGPAKPAAADVRWARPARSAASGAPETGAAASWVPLVTPRGTQEARVTYYGPAFGDGRHHTASGELYTDYDQAAALGPSMLAEARALTGERWPSIRLTTGEGRQYILPVYDTGGWDSGVELEVDLPGDGREGTWGRISGRPWSSGLFYARVDVLIGAAVAPEQRVWLPLVTLSLRRCVECPTPNDPIPTGRRSWRRGYSPSY